LSKNEISPALSGLLMGSKFILVRALIHGAGRLRLEVKDENNN